MGSVSTIMYKGISILYNDMSEARPSDVIELCMQSREAMKKCAPHSVYVLVNVKNIRFNSQVIQVIKETTKINSPFVKTTAVYGLEGFTLTLVQMVAKFSGRELRPVATLEEGKEWLVEQAAQQTFKHSVV